MTTRQRCGFTGKLLYTKEEAREMIRRWKLGGRHRRIHGPCIACNHWHLTKGQRGRGFGRRGR